MITNRNLIIIGVVILILLLIYHFGGMNYGYESFCSSPYSSSAELDSQFTGSTAGVKRYLVDNMTCSPSCCGDQWPVPFDGLTSREVESCIENRGTPGPFVRTNYMCGNGINGVGCPCIPKNAYKFLAERGQNFRTGIQVDPTLLIRDQPKPFNESLFELSPYETIQSRKSMFRDDRRLNDLSIQRSPQGLADVVNYGTNMTTADKQLSREFSMQ